jgi:hypothetical protein
LGGEKEEGKGACKIAADLENLAKKIPVLEVLSIADYLFQLNLISKIFAILLYFFPS